MTHLFCDLESRFRLPVCTAIIHVVDQVRSNINTVYPPLAIWGISDHERKHPVVNTYPDNSRQMRLCTAMPDATSPKAVSIYFYTHGEQNHGAH